MNPRRRRWAATVAGLAVVGASISCSSDAGSVRSTTTASATTSATGPERGTDAKVAEDAFLAGFPLVTTTRIMQQLAGFAGGANRLFWQPKLSDSSSRTIVSPNRDTLYSVAVLDLRGEPQALTLPVVTDRYYSVQVIDAWGTTVANIGTRATDARAGTWLFVPPTDDGTPRPRPDAPGGTTVIDVPTNRALLLGRFRAVTEADVAVIRAETRTAALHPLSSLTGGAPVAPPTPLGAAPGPITEVGSDGAAYWDELGAILAAEPPRDGERARALRAAGRLGVGPGRTPSTGEHRTLLAEAVTEGLAAIDRAGPGEASGATTSNGWTHDPDLGVPGREHSLLADAVVARRFWGPNEPKESTYALATTDTAGQPLTGASTHTIHFDAGQLPPVSAFWSVTLYGPDHFLFDNPERRYNVSGQSPGLVKNVDGSLDIVVGPTAPPGREGNWLPAPTGEFTLLLRLYLPGPSVLDGSWPYPSITAVR